MLYAAASWRRPVGASLQSNSLDFIFVVAMGIPDPVPAGFALSDSHAPARTLHHHFAAGAASVQRIRWGRVVLLNRGSPMAFPVHGNGGKKAARRRRRHANSHGRFVTCTNDLVADWPETVDVLAEIDVHPKGGVEIENFTKVRTQVVSVAVVVGADKKSLALQNRTTRKEAAAVECKSSDLSLRRQSWIYAGDDLVWRTVDLARAAASAASRRIRCYSVCVHRAVRIVALANDLQLVQPQSRTKLESCDEILLLAAKVCRVSVAWAAPRRKRLC